MVKQNVKTSHGVMASRNLKTSYDGMVSLNVKTQQFHLYEETT
jgi:hypothetical protein